MKMIITQNTTKLSKAQRRSAAFLYRLFCAFYKQPCTERDLRMIKVKEKISGTFTSFKGGEIFARIRGYISTVKKNNRPVPEELSNVLKGKPYMPCGIVY